MCCSGLVASSASLISRRCFTSLPPHAIAVILVYVTVLARALPALTVALRPLAGSDSGLGVTPSADAAPPPPPMAGDAALLAGPPPAPAAAPPSATPLLQQTGPVFYPTPQMDGSIPLEQLKQRLQHQLEYYFSR